MPDITPFVGKLRDAGIRVSLFIDAELAQIEAAHRVAADIVELHTGTYCEAMFAQDAVSSAVELDRLTVAAEVADELGLEVHAGHGLTFDTVAPVAQIRQLRELNIGHFLVGEAIFSGLDSSIRRMRALMDRARADISGSRTA